MRLPVTPIPNEILHEIFRIATGVSDPLICFEQDYHRTRRGASGRPFKHYQESLVTKLAICLVSRVWNTIATPLLYERIVMSSAIGDRQTRRRKMRRLIHTLRPPSPESSPTDNAGNSHVRLGAFVRRLDLTFPEGREEAEFARENVSGTLVELVEALPNLIMLNIRTTAAVSPLNTLAALSPKLKHLHWRAERAAPEFRIPISPFLNFLECHPSLETVHIIYDFEGLEPGPEQASLWEGKTFSSVSHWALRMNQASILAGIPTTAFPSLERLTYPYYPHAKHNLTRFTEFVSVHGSRLKTIRISPHTQLRGMLDVVARWCPQLREVHLVYKRKWASASTIETASVGFRMPRITTLGLSLYNYDEKKHSTGWEATIMLKWKDVFPNLQTIRLLEEKDVESLRRMTEAQLGGIVGHCLDYGVSLRDDSGNTFIVDSR